MQNIETKVNKFYKKQIKAKNYCQHIEFSIDMGNYCYLDNNHCYRFSLKQDCLLRTKELVRENYLRKDNYMFVKNGG